MALRFGHGDSDGSSRKRSFSGTFRVSWREITLSATEKAPHIGMLWREITLSADAKSPAYAGLFVLAKDTSLIQNAPGRLVPVCRVNTLGFSRLFRVQSVKSAGYAARLISGGTGI